MLDAAYAVVAEGGLEGLRTRDVAAKAGVNVATLHYYFSTKEKLIEALVRHVRTIFAANATSARSEGNALGNHLEHARRMFSENRELSTVLLELALRARRSAQAREAFQAVFASWNADVSSLLGGTPKAKASAIVVTSFVMGAMMQLGVDAKAFDFSKVSRRLTRLLKAE